MFLGTSFSEAFWKDFGRVLGGRNPQFSHFFVFDSKLSLKDFLEGKKIAKNGQQGEGVVILRPARRNVRGPGER